MTFSSTFNDEERYHVVATSALAAELTAKPYDFIVFGAGIVGAALAYSLGKSGRKVALVERDIAKPDRIVGELLQPGGVQALSMLGMQSALEDIDAVAVEGYQVFYGPRSVPIPYPFHDALKIDKGKAIESSSGKVEGRSFHHGNFIQALRTLACQQPNVTFIEATVRDLRTDDSGKIIGIQATRKAANSEVEDILELRAGITIVADGCFSKFRRTHGSSIAPQVRSNFVGLELSHAPLPAPNHGHVVLAPAGPILLYQISPVHTRILIDVPGEKLPSAAKGELQKHIRENVVPFLPSPDGSASKTITPLGECLLKELDGEKQRLRSMPNSFLPPSMQGQRNDRKGVIVVGDAMNMRHPLTGGGMSVGLWDVVHLTNALGGSEWLPSQTPRQPPVDLAQWDKHVRPALRSWHWNRKGLSSVINILAQALYSLFGANDENLEVLREGCFKYFELGGECVGGPVRLLSGLAPQPMLLVYHFFSVALYSIKCLFTSPRPYPSGKSDGSTITRAPSAAEWPALFWRSIMVFWTACVVLLPVIFTELKSNVPKFSSPSTSTSAASKAGSGSAMEAVKERSTLLFLSAAALMAWIYMGHGSTVGSATSVAGKASSDWLTFPRALAQS